MAIRGRIQFYLSDVGRRDSLRRGGDGKRHQFIEGEVHSRDLDAFTVDEEGRTTFDARTTPEEIAVEGIRHTAIWDQEGHRIEVEWDVVPTWAQLCDLAVRIQPLREKAFEEYVDSAQREQELKEEVVRAFVADPSARAERFDKQMVVIGGQRFSASAYPELWREANQRAENDRNNRRETARAVLSRWIADHGTDNQRERLAARLLPWREAEDAMEHALFTPLELEGFELYERFNASLVCQCRENWDDPPCEVKFQSTDADVLTADEWDVFKAIQNAMPGAQFQLREHKASCPSRADDLIRRGVIVKCGIDPVTFKREYKLTLDHERQAS